MICPKCQKEFTKVTAHECPITDTYICPECRVGLSDGVTDEIRVVEMSVPELYAFANAEKLATEGKLF